MHRRDAHAFFREYMIDVPWTGTYLAYDMAVLIQEFPELTRIIFDKLQRGDVHDIGVRQKLIDIARGFRKKGGKGGNPYKLENLAHRYLGWDLEKDGGWRLKYALLRDTPVSAWPSGAIHYAQLDAIAPWKIQHAQESRRNVKGYDVFRDEANQVRAEFALHLMSAWGLKTDHAWAKRLDGIYAEEMEGLFEELKKVALIREDYSRNTKQAKVYMREAMGDRCKITDKGIELMGQGMSKVEVIEKGYIALDGESCKVSGNPNLEKLARYAHLQKMRGTYLAGILTSKVMHARYEGLVDTGRTSCSNPPIQQLPREFGPRECFVPRDGMLFAACDYDMAELVSLANLLVHLFGRSNLANALKAGFDPHLGIAAELMHIPYEEAKRRYKAGDKEVKKYRQMAKAANFGLPGGLGPDTFMIFAKSNYGVTLTRAEAVALKELWFQMWPEMHDYFAWVRSLLQAEGGKRATYCQLVTGRVRGRCKYTQICNTGFQGSSADGGKKGLFEITRRQFCEPTSSLYGTHVVAFLHDENILEVPETIAHEAAMEMRKVMVEEYNTITTHVPVGASPHLMRRWHKDAEPVFNRKGELVPWQDPLFV